MKYETDMQQQLRDRGSILSFMPYADWERSRSNWVGNYLFSKMFNEYFKRGVEMLYNEYDANSFDTIA